MNEVTDVFEAVLESKDDAEVVRSWHTEGRGK